MSIIDDINIRTVTFTPRPLAVPFGARISYRVAQVCLLLEYCVARNSGCSELKVQTISNALSSQTSEMRDLINYAKRPSLYVHFTQRIDPCVTNAIAFALRDGLCERLKNTKYKITKKGRDFVYSIVSDGELLTREIRLLQELGTTLSEELAESIGR
ncbi:hypothetical protein FACS1894211_16590 [Clostridia bacterium]|nr:hypothetical protein FACS1894211_16590 [Clostridia bacterium]